MYLQVHYMSVAKKKGIHIKKIKPYCFENPSMVTVAGGLFIKKFNLLSVLC